MDNVECHVAVDFETEARIQKYAIAASKKVALTLFHLERRSEIENRMELASVAASDFVAIVRTAVRIAGAMNDSYRIKVRRTNARIKRARRPRQHVHGVDLGAQNIRVVRHAFTAWDIASIERIREGLSIAWIEQPRSFLALFAIDAAPVSAIRSRSPQSVIETAHRERQSISDQR